MNMGARIKELLRQKDWRQIDLLEKVPSMEAGALSAMINRDSRFSEHAFEIAKAFGVSLDFLIFGINETTANRRTISTSHLNATDTCELLTTYAALDEAGRSFVLEAARDRLRRSSLGDKRNTQS